MPNAHASSVQEFGLNRFPQPFSHASDANMGILIPIMWSDVPFGSVIDNNVDMFVRSSALVDPAFLDCDLSIGHYFVSYEAMDPYFRYRLRDFKRSQSEVKLPQFGVDFQDGVYYSETGNVTTDFGPGSLADRLGLCLATQFPGFTPGGGAKVPDETLKFSVYPFAAYHMIADWFFTNRKLQNCYATQQCLIKLLTGEELPYIGWNDWDNAISEVQSAFFSGGNNLPQSVDSVFFPWELRTLNFEPDYFTSCHNAPGGPDVYLPGTTQNPSAATVRNMLDSELLQKVADMLYNGGYSSQDFVRTLYGFDPGDHESEEPVYLGGTTVPLQVSTVVQQSTGDTPLGTQAGNVSAYASGQNHVRKVAMRSGVYMVLAWIRPKIYYTNFVDRNFFKTQVGDFLIPQLADASNEPVFQYELTGDPRELVKEESARSVFGYNDRYESYRTRVNRASGTLRTTRQSWINVRTYGVTASSPDPFVISPDFLNIRNSVTYTPWVVTSPDTPHFFFRAHCSYVPSHLLPARSHPYIW